MPGDRLDEALLAFHTRDHDEPSAEEPLGGGMELRELLDPMLDEPCETAESSIGDSLKVPCTERLEKLVVHRPPVSRYRVGEEIARGGMGVIRKVWDEDLHREMAMKVVLSGQGETAARRALYMERFLKEAQVTGQLDHPGIVPVHELGVDEQGQAFFTMRLVRGRELSAVFHSVYVGTEGWTQVRALEIFVKVCDTLAYAHSKGVIHRDIKPSNIMVGRFGEVYVMDWGVAKVLAHPDGRDGSLSSMIEVVEPVRTDRGDPAGGSSFATKHGTVIGTPSYMSPEQAEGDIDGIDPRTDVYGVGAMLYELLSGSTPYSIWQYDLKSQAILDFIRQGPPPPIAKLAPQAPPELVAITEKAMQHDKENRYPSMDELAEDLRAYLEHRVVRAHESGAWAELRKWVRRNRALAASMVAAMLVLLAGLVVGFVFYGLAEGSRMDEARAREEAERRAEQERKAREDLRELASFSTIDLLATLRREADEQLWPLHPAAIPAIERWLERAEEMKPLLESSRSSLAELEAQALPRSASMHYKWIFPDGEVLSAEDRRWQHALLSDLVVRLRDFTEGPEDRPEGSLRIWGSSLAEVRQRRSVALRLREIHESEESRRAWSSAVEDIGRRDGPYEGLRLEPILGLVPLGRNERTGLWEFWHVASGERPEVDPSWKAEPLLSPSRWSIRDRMGLVFVLIPAGKFWMGAQSEDPGAPNYDPCCEDQEAPVREVQLSAFLLSKYELTQGQWMRIASENPSAYAPGANGEGVSWTNPVEQVSWDDCDLLLRRIGLALPTEAQWEYACRAGTTTPWWTGDTRETLLGAVRIADRAGQRTGVHAPVGSRRANAFGLHDVHGNLWEWCRDRHVGYENPVQPGDGLRMGAGADRRAIRGGCFGDDACGTRSAARSCEGRNHREARIGVRPMLPLP